MHRQEHTQRILARLRQECNELYIAFPKTVEEIVEEVNCELDFGFIFSDNPEEMLRNREKMHNKEGIKKVTADLAKRYGTIYRELIKQAATQHVVDDMGRVYKRKDYRDKYFWPKWQAQNETQCAWL